jgi:hypothetical protein
MFAPPARLDRRGESRRLTAMTNRLRIEVSASPGSNDHQARLIVDGLDWLGAGQLGLDPPELEAALAAGSAEELVVGRCGCGCVGCSDTIVRVVRRGDSIEWSAPGADMLRFNLAQYEAERLRFAADKSWETLGRTVERELGTLFEGCSTDDGCRFEWASTRIAEGRIHLSFSGDGEQVLLDFDWDGASLAGALETARAFRRRQFGR